MKRMSQGKAILTVVVMTIFVYILSGFDISVIVFGLKAIAFWILWPLSFMLLALVFISVKSLIKKVWSRIKKS